ncbi:UDP-glucose dehydrogenase family protein [Oricola indica]|jgi:UDPglucose 6-dehydrogenase|uniref:UDP-glucose dehydrogenase family protein n=1 Tax=Oricola indica TaxID=2872591 RepID=UPI001CBE5EAA|nr:UDP-glucose/GDP-mannose dehydrogenase family protein [Oricola indica]
MKITMIGAGYVGLVSGACFADIGHDVICVDRDETKLDALRAGSIPIYEPGLEQIVTDNVRAERLSFSADLEASVKDADAVFIAVGTPSRAGDGLADLTHVYTVARTLAPMLADGTIVVTKSTVPVGTGDEIEHLIRSGNPTADIAVVSNPEFLREGSAIADFKEPDRIVIGTDDVNARGVMRDLYAPLGLDKDRILMTGRRTAELTKYAANSFLAMKVTYINEIADLCEKVGADVLDVAQGIGMDNRIGRKFLNAGPGIGGSCFPKDTLALVRTAHDADSPMRLVETTVTINDQRKRSISKKVIRGCGGSVRGKTIAVLGLTFKPDTDDVRESPALPLIRALQDAGARIRAFDPEGTEQARDLLSNVTYCDDAYHAAEGTDAVVIVTEWAIFRNLDLTRLKETMATPVMVDLRNIQNPDVVRMAGFSYHGVGRGESGDGLSPLLVQAAE